MQRLEDGVGVIPLFGVDEAAGVPVDKATAAEGRGQTIEDNAALRRRRSASLDICRI
jgi:hypothetical protein